MWNKILSLLFLAGCLFCFDIYPQDSIVIATEATPADSSRILAPDSSRVLPGDLTQFQRDSIIEAIPRDTASLDSQRYFGGSLIEKYANDDEFDYERNINKSFFQRLKEVISRFLGKLFGRTDVPKINNLSGIILKVLLVFVFLAAVFIVVRLFMNHRGNWFFEKKDKAVAVTLSNVEKHIHEADFEALLQEAEQEGDTRQSIRLLYLWLLKSFTDREILRWNPDKTNIDYLTEIQDRALQEQFRYLSYLYNYIWYGGFSISDSEYRNARKTFLRHIKTGSENE